MNVGTFIQPTSRGQIVIPANFRRQLGINESTLLNVKAYSGILVVQPVTPVSLVPETDTVFLAFLKKHRGFMGNDPNFSPAKLKKRKAAELKRQASLKKIW